MLVHFAEESLEDLSRRIARDLVEKDHLSRDFVAGEMVFHIRFRIVLRECLSLMEDDEGLEALSERFVLDADHGHFE